MFYRQGFNDQACLLCLVRLATCADGTRVKHLYACLCMRGAWLSPAMKPWEAPRATTTRAQCKLFMQQEIVALSGAHTLGRAYPQRSGLGELLCSICSRPHTAVIATVCAQLSICGQLGMLVVSF